MLDKENLIDNIEVMLEVPKKYNYIRLDFLLELRKFNKIEEEYIRYIHKIYKKLYKNMYVDIDNNVDTSDVGTSIEIIIYKM